MKCIVCLSCEKYFACITHVSCTGTPQGDPRWSFHKTGRQRQRPSMQWWSDITQLAAGLVGIGAQVSDLELLLPHMQLQQEGKADIVLTNFCSHYDPPSTVFYWLASSFLKLPELTTKSQPCIKCRLEEDNPLRLRVQSWEQTMGRRKHATLFLCVKESLWSVIQLTHRRLFL